MIISNPKEVTRIEYKTRSKRSFPNLICTSFQSNLDTVQCYVRNFSFISEDYCNRGFRCKTRYSYNSDTSIESSGRRICYGRTDLSELKMVGEVEANGIIIKNASLCPSLLTVVINHAKAKLLCISSGPLTIKGSPQAINIP